jgi:hypothetical protein
MSNIKYADEIHPYCRTSEPETYIVKWKNTIAGNEGNFKDKMSFSEAILVQTECRKKFPGFKIWVEKLTGEPK